jgi:uncharacterized protein YbjT (DUF2867 family)
VARCLIVACGCRGAALARELTRQGHVVRGTTRAAGGRARIEQAGADAIVADPDRIATLAPALEHVGVVCVLLGSAIGEPARVAALHTTRLDMLLTRIVDTTVRGIVYEAAGRVDRTLLADGAARVRAFCQDSRIPCAVLDAEPADHRRWLEAALSAVRGVLGEA